MSPVDSANAAALDSLRRLGALEAALDELGGRALRDLVRSWELRAGDFELAWVGDDPVPMLGLVVAARLDRELEAALVVRSEVWAESVPSPLASTLVEVLRRTTDVPPQARTAVVPARLALWTQVEKWPNPAPKARALLAASRVWVLSTARKRLDAALESIRWGDGVGTVNRGGRRWQGRTTGAGGAAAAEALRAKVPFEVLVAGLIRSAGGKS